MDDWGARLEEAILKQVGRSLDRAGPGAPPGVAPADDEAREVQDVDAMGNEPHRAQRPALVPLRRYPAPGGPATWCCQIRSAFGSVLTQAWITASSDHAWGRHTEVGTRVSPPRDAGVVPGLIGVDLAQPVVGAMSR